MRNSANRNWRGRSPENIVNEMLYLHKKFHAQTFNFVDEDFLGPPKDSLARARCFSREIEKNHLDVTFGIQVRPNSLSEEIIGYLVKAGLKYVFMGIESDNPDDFIRWGRVYCDKTWDWVGILQRENVEINAGTLLFHPDSTFHGIRTFAEKLRQCRLFNFRTAINRLDAMPGSFFHKKYLSELQDIGEYIGIFHLPFANPGVDSFYQDINRVLAPIEAPSMHAICALPPVQTRRKLSATNETQYQQLKEIINACDDQVGKCFFLILGRHEILDHSEELLNDLLMENRAFSKTIVSRLIDQGFVRSPEMLYRAINQDA